MSSEQIQNRFYSVPEPEQEPISGINFAIYDDLANTHSPVAMSSLYDNLQPRRTFINPDLYHAAFGPIDSGLDCSICGLSTNNCPGHNNGESAGILATDALKQQVMGRALRYNLHTIEPTDFTDKFIPLASNYSLNDINPIYGDMVCDCVPDHILDEVNCCICLDIMVQPKVLSCGHTTCSKCVNKLINTKYISFLRYEKYIKCPICRSESDLTRPDNIALKNIINCLKIVCYHKSCEWVGTLGTLNDHLKECLLSTITCNYCKLPMFLKDFKAHSENDCVNFPIKCPDCDLLGKKNLLSAHQTNKCIHRFIACKDCKERIKAKDHYPHAIKCSQRKSVCNQCNELVLSSDLNNHKINICPNRITVCRICNNTVQTSTYEEGHLVLCKIKQEQIDLQLQQKQNKKKKKRELKYQH
jgi:hypothetical protein